MLNHIVIMGRLTRDPEVRYTQSQVPVASFTLAVDRDFGGKDGSEKQTDFIDCVAWRQTAEFVSRNAAKGRLVVVSGRLQISSYNDRDGNKRNRAEVVTDNMYFCERRENNGTGSYNANSYGSQPTYSNDSAPRSSAPTGGFAEMDDGDGELPF